MLKNHKNYTLYKRQPKTGKAVYYVRFRLPDGTRTPGRSTGQTNKNAAERWAENELNNGQVIRKIKTLNDFATGFFEWDSDYSINRRSTGKRISERQCIELTALLDDRILQELGTLPLTSLNKATITEYRNKLYRENVSPTTINRILSMIDRILKAAEEKELIQGVPRVDKVANRTVEKGTLNTKEIIKLFNTEWTDNRARVACMLAFATGCRMGELLALQRSDFSYPDFADDSNELQPIDWTDPEYKPGTQIIISRSWNQKLNIMNPTTKTGKTRIAYPPPGVFAAIYDLVQEAEAIGITGPDSFIFYAASDPRAKGGMKKTEFSDNRPCDGKLITKHFYKVLKTIKVNRIERSISFHSFRVMFNSLLINSGIPAAKVQALTGHSSMKMTTETYYRPDDMKDVTNLVTGILEAKPEPEAKK